MIICIMLCLFLWNSMEESLDVYCQKKRPHVIEKESLWRDSFWVEYDPNFDYSKIFFDIEKNIKSRWDIVWDKKILLDIINEIKNNNYKLTIDFLESFDSEKKHLIAQSFLLHFWKQTFSLLKQYWIPKSLVLRILYQLFHDFENDNFLNYFYKLWEWDWFNSLYFKQAYKFLGNYIDAKNEDNDKFLFHVIAEYNLIKTLDWNIRLINEENILNLWKDLCIGTFHTKNKSWYWWENKYWTLNLDYQWWITSFYEEWRMENEEWIKKYITEKKDNGIIMRVLNRNNSYFDASWISYRVYMDCPSWIALFYQNKPIACMNFFIRNWNEFFVNQIQRVMVFEYDKYGRCVRSNYSKIPEVLNKEKIDWRDILYMTIVNLAKKYNIERIIIQSGENNRRTWEFWSIYDTTPYLNYLINNWLLSPDKKVRLSHRIAYQIYDIFAKSHWWKLDEQQNYCINLT